MRALRCVYIILIVVLDSGTITDAVRARVCGTVQYAPIQPAGRSVRVWVLARGKGVLLTSTICNVFFVTFFSSAIDACHVGVVAAAIDPGGDPA